MSTVTQGHKATDPEAERSKTVRIRGDVWESARVQAFEERKTITEVLDSALREHFSLPPASASDSGADVAVDDEA